MWQAAHAPSTRGEGRRAGGRALTLVGLVEGDDAVVVAVEERHVLLQLRHAGGAWGWGAADDGSVRRCSRVVATPFSIGKSTNKRNNNE